MFVLSLASDSEDMLCTLQRKAVIEELPSVTSWLTVAEEALD